MKSFIAYLSLLLIVITGTVNAQNHLAEGWKSFLANDRQLARTEFTEALKSSEQRKEALLGLTLLCMNDTYLGQPFTYFKQFCSEEKEPAPYIHALWFSGILNSNDPAVQLESIKFVQELAGSNDVSLGTLRAMANSRLGKFYTDKKKFIEAEKAFAKIGALDEWAIAGEFENISASGFDKSYETLKLPVADALFVNKYGAKVKWFTPPFKRKDKWFDFTYYFNYENSVVFAQCFVKSPRRQEVQLRAGVSGSMKIWLNDQLVVSESEERNNDLDNYNQKVELNEGYNRVLVQVGESYAGRSNFLIRFTDDNGNAVTGLNSVASVQAYKPAAPYKGEKIGACYESFFEDKVKALPGNALNQILLANIYLQNDRLFEARHVIDQLKSTYPKSTYVNSLLLQLFTKTNNRTGLESTQEAIKMDDPGHPWAINFFYNSAIEKEDIKGASEYADKYEALFGKEDEEVLLKRINLAGKNKNQVEMIRLAELAYTKHPQNRSFVEFKYLIENNLRKNSKAAIAVLKEYLQDNDDYVMAKALAQIYFDSGSIDAGIKIYLTEIENDPVGVGIYTSLAKIYGQLQNYPKAEELLRKAIAIAPYQASYHSDLAQLLNNQGRKAEAIAEYKMTLELNPNSYIAIRELRKLENKKDVFDYFEPYDVQQAVRNAPAASAYPDDNVLILNESTQAVIYPGGGSEERHLMLAKILNTSGLDGWKEYAASVKNWQNYIIEDAEVIKSNGSKVPAEVNETQIVFTNLEVGDCVFVRYKLYNYSQGQLANKFWDSFYFSHGYPYIKSEYSVLAARNQKIYYKFSQKDIAPVKTESDEFLLYHWVNQNQPSLQYEDKMPPLDDVANVLNVTTIPDWSFISNWYNDLASAKAKPAYEVKEAVSVVLGGDRKLTDTEKAERIYNYITSNITYSSVPFRQSGLIPQNPSAVLNTRIGDCKDVSTLFLSMAKEAGINAQLVLVNTKNAGVEAMVLPSINFNHCIVKINTDGRERYLELTSNYLPFSSFSEGEINSAILDIDGTAEAKSIKYLDPKTRKINSILRNTFVSIEQENLVVNERNVRVAAPAAYLREAYLNLSVKDREKRMQEALGKSFQSAELMKLSFRNLENAGNRDTLFTDIAYRIKDDVKTVGGLNILSLPWSDKAAPADFSLSFPRHFSLDISQLYDFDSESETLVLQIPAGKKIIENIPAINLSNEYMDYSLTVKSNGKNITYSRTLRLKKAIVPAAQVAAFQEFYKKIISADNKQLAFR
ncbi:transglutaminase domain-containing protein [Arcticibacter tournemirensis]